MNEPSFLLLTENVIIYALKPTAKYAGWSNNPFITLFL
jgi:hypothetical protein